MRSGTIGGDHDDNNYAAADDDDGDNDDRNDAAGDDKYDSNNATDDNDDDDKDDCNAADEDNDDGDRPSLLFCLLSLFASYCHGTNYLIKVTNLLIIILKGTFHQPEFRSCAQFCLH